MKINRSKSLKIPYIFIFFGVLVFSAFHSAQAEVYKCETDSGKIEFSDSPCANNAKGGKIVVKPNSLDTSAVREQNLREQNQQLQEKLNSNTGNSQQTNNTANSSLMDSYACKQAKRDYEVTASSIDKDPAMLQMRSSAMYAACGIREPDRKITNIKIENNPILQSKPISKPASK